MYSIQESRCTVDYFYNQLPHICLIVDGDGAVRHANNEAQSFFGKKIDIPAQTELFQFLDVNDELYVRSIIEESIKHPEKQHKIQVRVLDKDNVFKKVYQTYKYVGFHKEQELVQVILDQPHAIHLLENEEVDSESSSGLIDREEFESVVTKSLGDRRRRFSDNVLGYIDIDRFGVVNDLCGYVAGDELLKKVGNVIRQTVRESDVVARIGGDEFGFLLKNCTPKEAEHIATKIQNKLVEDRFCWDEKTFPVSVSIGLISTRKNHSDYKELMKKAGGACFSAKEHGGNNLCFFDRGDNAFQQKQNNSEWINKITNAIQMGDLQLFLQPVVSTSSNEEGFYEVLVRLNDNGEIVSPDQFLPVAERYGLIHQVDKWVINSSLNELAEDIKYGNNIKKLAINISGASLGNHELLQFIINKLEETGTDKGRVCFEITETSAILNLDKAIKFITTLKAYGCNFALDDFGTGMSSYEYLKNIPVDYIKIDGSFINDMTNSMLDYEIVRSINQIGHDMGKKIIAEHVEDQKTYDALIKLGVDYVQGFVFGRPKYSREIIERAVA